MSQQGVRDRPSRCPWGFRKVRKLGVETGLLCTDQMQESNRAVELFRDALCLVRSDFTSMSVQKPDYIHLLATDLVILMSG